MYSLKTNLVHVPSPKVEVLPGEIWRVQTKTSIDCSALETWKMNITFLNRTFGG